MNIRIRYFASLREIVGHNEEQLNLLEGATVSDARTALLARYPRLQPIMERCLCAVNRGYVAPEATLHEGDELVFIPPMGGGGFLEVETWNHLFN
jgi:molybdopterin converting factor subunit 1